MGRFGAFADSANSVSYTACTAEKIVMKRMYFQELILPTSNKISKSLTHRLAGQLLVPSFVREKVWTDIPDFAAKSNCWKLPLESSQQS